MHVTRQHPHPSSHLSLRSPKMKALSIDDVNVEDPKSTFCVAVGWPGVALYALALTVAGAHLYIAAEFTFFTFSSDMQRECLGLSCFGCGQRAVGHLPYVHVAKLDRRKGKRRSRDNNLCPTCQGLQGSL